MRRAAIYILGVLVLLAAPAAAAAKPRPLYWGAWIGSQLTGKEAPWDMGAASSFQGRRRQGPLAAPVLGPVCPLRSRSLQLLPLPDRRDGEDPRLRGDSALQLELRRLRRRPGGTSRLADLNAGRYDAYIQEFARAAAAWGHPFFLRFDWEMNGNWFPWGAGVNGNTAGRIQAGLAPGPRHLRRGRCDQRDLGLVPVRQRNESLRLRPFYPGGRYVDWTCLDTYNWGPESPSPRSGAASANSSLRPTAASPNASPRTSRC